MTAAAVTARWGAFREDLRKIPAFSRRDLLVLWSYRASFFSDWLSLLGQIVVFYFIGRLVDPGKIPRFGGGRASYVEFVAIGIAFSSFLQVSLARVANVIRQEQLMGTLEPLLVSPTSPAIIQLGSVAFDLVYVPVRTAVFLALVAVLLDVRFSIGGALPTAVVMFVFIPFVWGLGVASAAGVLTYRRGSGAVGIGISALTVGSVAYFPAEVLPGWLRPFAEANPITIALDATRKALLGGAGWSEIWPSVALLVPIGLVSLAVGTLAFRAALGRERRRGTLGLY